MKKRRKYEPYKIPRPAPTERINEHKMALEIVAQEGKKVSLPIGQVKEVIKLTLDYLAKQDLLAVARLVLKHKIKRR